MALDIKTYPAEFKSHGSEKRAISAEIYGNRFHADQTLYEYLIEFLLVFVSEDLEGVNPKEKLSFHSPDAIGNLDYVVEPRIALKRFIFFDKNKKNDLTKIDQEAYSALINALKDKIEDADDDVKMDIIEALQDLLHGYATVLKKRTWCAQAMLPLCPELVFCEAMPKKRARASLKWSDIYYSDDEQIKKKVDTEFDFDKRNFLARGGELYYLHILQGLQGKPDKKNTLENLLREQLVVSGAQMSQIANFVQNTWEEHMGYEESPKQRLHMSFIPENAYKSIAADSVDELISFLSCKMHPVKKIELLSKGVMIQIMRMLSVATTNYLGQDRECWIIDINGSNIVKKIASNSFSQVQGTFTTAIGKNMDAVDGAERLKLIAKAKKDSFDIFKSKGKELQCIIPTSGPFERFSLPEDCLRFLVLALIEPQKKMTLDMFLNELYKKYRIVIGPNQYKMMIGEDISDVALANSFNDNVVAFQEFLKATGFLRELSDATSIVINPYKYLEGEQE